MRMAILQKISCALLIFVLLFCPLAFGTVENWSYLIMETAAALSGLLACAALAKGAGRPLAVPGALPLFLLLCYMLLHLLPLPAPLVKFLSPATFEMYRPLLELDPAISSIPLSLNGKGTLLQFFTFGAYTLVYFLTVQHCSGTACLKRTTTIVVTLGIIIAVVAILQKFTAGGTIYWFRATPNSTPVGPWVYSNHFAGFMEMLFPLAVALFLYYRPRIDYGLSFREKCLATLTMPGANSHLLLGSGAVLMAASILLSISRGGIITLALAFLFFVLFSARTAASPRNRWAAVLTILVLLLITWFGWEPIIGKFGNLWGEEGLDTSGRLPVFQDSLALLRTFPLTGAGFGAFIHVYPMVRTVPGDAIFDHAHNDYIEILADGGVIGFILCGWFVLAVLTHAVRALIRRRDRYAILLTSASLTGMLALLFHSLADFQMYNGANGLYFFFLCGLTVSAVNTRHLYRSSPTYLPETRRQYLILPALLAIVLLAGSCWYRTQSSRAEHMVTSMNALFLNRHIPSERLRELHQRAGFAEERDPLSPRYPSAMGQLSALLLAPERAQQEFLRAALRQPSAGPYLQQLAASLPLSEANRAKELFNLSLRREPLVIERYLTYGDWLLDRQLKDEARTVLARAMLLIPWRTTDTLRFLLRRGITPEELKGMLPPVAAAWHEAGKRLEKGWPEEAELYYLRAIELLHGEDARPEYFSRPYALYRRGGQEGDALALLRRGVQALPDHAPFRILLGDHYVRQNIPYRAMEEYQQALRLEPNNRNILKKIENLAADSDKLPSP